MELRGAWKIGSHQKTSATAWAVDRKHGEGTGWEQVVFCAPLSLGPSRSLAVIPDATRTVVKKSRETPTMKHNYLFFNYLYGYPECPWKNARNHTSLWK